MGFPVYIYSCFICAIIGFLCWRPASHRYLKLFPFFILISAIGEYIGWQMKNLRVHNTALYNYLSAFEFTFYLFLVRYIIVNAKMKAVIAALLVLYPLYCIININLIQGPQTFHAYSYCTGCLLVVLVCVYYFYELFQRPDTVNLIREPAFWICSGLLFFCTVSFPLIGLTNYIYRISPIIILNLLVILNVMNTMLYAMFTIGFLFGTSFGKPVLRTNG
jgi:hypothetical protein